MHGNEGLDLVDPEAARATIADLGVAGGTEHVPLSEARGRTLAEPVVADADVPGFDRASMDGYAVRAADTAGASRRSPAELAPVGSTMAGRRPEATVEAGETVEVATGSVLPPGADAVVMVEETGRDGDVVAVRDAVAPGENVAPAGADVAAGDHGLSAGVRLTPRTIGLLAALGWAEVPVAVRPTVAVVPTGDELVAAGDDLRPEAGQVHDVNTPALAAAIDAAGARPVVRERVGDDPEALAAALQSAASEADLVLTSGATSAGATDVLVDVIEDGLGEVLIHGIRFKPGKPTIVGRVAGTPYVGLPGYPVSALSVFRALVAPALAPDADADRSVEATAVRELRNDGGRHRLYAVGVIGDGDGDRIAYPVDKGSGATTSLAYADGVVEIPAATNYRAAGERVTVERFDHGAPAALLVVGERDVAVREAAGAVGRARYLARAGDVGRRWLEDGVADAAVVVGDVGPPAGADRVAAWDREFGIVHDPDVAVEGLADLAGVGFVSLARETGLRGALDDAAAELDDALPETVGEYGEVVGLDSAVRRVRDGRADAGPALRASVADAVDAGRLGFLPLCSQRVAVDVSTDRRGKPGVDSFVGALEGAAPRGYDRRR